MKRIIYADNNATTKVSPEVLQEMLPYFSELYGNPSSAHSFGGQIAKKLNLAKERIAVLIGADSISEIRRTSGGTESDNTAINSALIANPEKKHIITTKVEHPAVLNYCKHLEKKGYSVTYLGVDEAGCLNLDELQNSISDNTALITVMWANNETGVIFPIEKIAEISRSKGVLFHTDAVQSAGKININLKKNNIDMLSISGHKLHAPKGIGALYINRKIKFKPLIIGGHQESGRRGGTENTASLIGLGKSCEIAVKNIEYENNAVKKMRDTLEKNLTQKIELTKVNGSAAERLPNTLNISFKNVEGESILLYLNEAGICASSGSACTTGSLEPSHVLMAMNVPFEFAHGSIRFSLGKYNTDEDIEYISDIVPGVIKRLREMSPFNG